MPRTKNHRLRDGLNQIIEAEKFEIELLQLATGITAATSLRVRQELVNRLEALINDTGR